MPPEQRDHRELSARVLLRRHAADAVAVFGAVVLVFAASLRGRELIAAGVDIFLVFPPLLAEWLPHVGPGSTVAVLVAVVVVARGPVLAEAMPWRPLLLVSWVSAFVWTMSLALVDGWQRGVVERLTSTEEYLHDVPRVTDIPTMLRVFADHIVTTQIDPAQTWFWTTHVGAHPPGVFLLFVWLDRIGLGGGGPAGIAVTLVGASSCAAVAVALRALGHEELARRVLPFSVLFPGAVWVGVSADGMFAAWLAWGVALLAVGAAVRGVRAGIAALAGGLLLGFGLYLSYGLVLGGLVPLAVVVATRRWRAVVIALVGVLAVVGAFTVAGFWWPDGFAAVRLIYAASIASTRPYSYFVWANIAAVLFALGPAVVVGVRRSVVGRPALGPALLVAAGAGAILLADLSGMSKGEVERIWLPFGVWVVVACGTIPRAQARWWLAAQAVLALAVNHLLLTVW